MTIIRQRCDRLSNDSHMTGRLVCHVSGVVLPFCGHSSVEMHSPSCSTVPGGQAQPERHIRGQGTFGSSQVPKQGAHSCLVTL